VFQARNPHDESFQRDQVIETQLAGIQHRLDQLANSQFERQLHELERTVGSLQNLARLTDRLSDNSSFSRHSNSDNSQRWNEPSTNEPTGVVRQTVPSPGTPLNSHLPNGTNSSSDSVGRARISSEESSSGNAVEVPREALPLSTMIFRPNYLSVHELNRSISPLLTDGIGEAWTSTASDEYVDQSEVQRGVGSRCAKHLSGRSDNDSRPQFEPCQQSDRRKGPDHSTNRDTLFVRDQASVLAEINRIAGELDVPPWQVSIEATILNVTLSEDQKCGLNLEQLHHGDRQLIAEGNGQRLPCGCGLHCGLLCSDTKTLVETLDRIADTKLVATPQIRVLNKQRAELSMGKRIGYRTHDCHLSPEHDDVRFLNAGTKLVIRPVVSNNGLIRLEIEPEVTRVSVDAATGMPSQDIAQVATSVLVQDGSTIVLGGLISEDTVESVHRTPVLGSIPVVRSAFRNRTEKTRRSEIIMLITPRIVMECQ
ncbi:MAG: hypothetical protein FJ267_08820, partial [Planctomycetes bacterium]|nr:hypothetical protein [Planctomycetota bacterium]